MAAALTPEQQRIVGEEIDRRTAAQDVVTSLKLQVLVEASKQQFLLETQALDGRMAEVQANLTSEIVGQVDARQSTIVSQFVGDNTNTRSEIRNLKEVMQAIGGDRFQEVSAKLASLDEANKHHLGLLSTMMRDEASMLRSESAKHEQALISQHQI